MRKHVPGLLLLFFWLALGGCAVPPEDELEAAQKQIEIARGEDASVYAPELMRSAEDLLSEASLKLSEKSYQEARTLANDALEKATQAEKAALENQKARRQQSATVVSDAGRRLAELRRRVEALAQSRERTRAKMLLGLEEAEGLLQLYREKAAAEKFGDIQNMESALQQQLQQLDEALTSALNPEPSKSVSERTKRESEKKAR